MTLSSPNLAKALQLINYLEKSRHKQGGPP